MAMCNTMSGVAVVLSACGVAGAALQQQVIFADVGPKSEIGGFTFDRFDRPVRSPNGQYWALLARNTGATTSDAMYIVGSGLTGAIEVHEGVTELEAGRFGEAMSDRRMGVNDRGEYVVTGGLTGATTDDEVLIRGTAGGTRSIVLREGAALGDGTTDLYGASNGSGGIRNDGTVSFAWQARPAGGTATAGPDAYFTSAGTRVATEGANGLVGGLNQLFWAVESGDWFLRNDSQIVVNGVVTISEGNNLAGVGVIETFLGGGDEMMSNGDWFARGYTTSDVGFAIKNGAVIARTGDAIVSGSSESWDNSRWRASGGATAQTQGGFFIATGDNAGNVVLGGITDNADQSRSVVWTYNNETVFMRSGDQIDIDGDGAVDDAFITWFFNDTSPEALGGFLADDGWFYTVVDFQNAAGTFFGEAFIRVRVPAPAGAGVLALAGMIASRRRRG